MRPSVKAQIRALAATTAVPVAAVAVLPSATGLAAAAPATRSFAHLLGTALSSAPTPFVPVTTLNSRPVAWIARVANGITLMSFDQSALELHLHSGTEDAGAVGWRYGPAIDASEAPRLLAAFNGGFKFPTGSGGFTSYGRTAVAMRPQTVSPKKPNGSPDCPTSSPNALLADSADNLGSYYGAYFVANWVTGNRQSSTERASSTFYWVLDTFDPYGQLIMRTTVLGPPVAIVKKPPPTCRGTRWSSMRRSECSSLPRILPAGPH